MSTRPGPGAAARRTRSFPWRARGCRRASDGLRKAVDEALDEPEVRVLTLDGIDQDGAVNRGSLAQAVRNRAALQVHLVPGMPSTTWRRASGAARHAAVTRGAVQPDQGPVDLLRRPDWAAIGTAVVEEANPLVSLTRRLGSLSAKTIGRTRQIQWDSDPPRCPPTVLKWARMSAAPGSGRRPPRPAASARQGRSATRSHQLVAARDSSLGLGEGHYQLQLPTANSQGKREQRGGKPASLVGCPSPHCSQVFFGSWRGSELKSSAPSSAAPDEFVVHQMRIPREHGRSPPSSRAEILVRIEAPAAGEQALAAQDLVDPAMQPRSRSRGRTGRRSGPSARRRAQAGAGFRLRHRADRARDGRMRGSDAEARRPRRADCPLAEKAPAELHRRPAVGGETGQQIRHDRVVVSRVERDVVATAFSQRRVTSSVR